MAALPVPQDVTTEVVMEKNLAESYDSTKVSSTLANLTLSSESPAASVAADLRQQQTVPLKVPIVDPVDTALPAPPAELTSEQQTKYKALLETAQSWTEIPSTMGKGGPVTDDEKMWLTRDCLLRYLRATKWNEKDAVKRVLGTLTWRREYGVWDMTAEHISPENETGKQIILGYDVSGRPCQYLNPGRQNTEPSPRQVQHLVFMVERVIDLMIPDQETLALLINFKSGKSRSNTAPGIGQARECLNILQTHYPERLGRALIINVPWIVNGFFKLITPFIDPLTRDKLKFNGDMTEHVPRQQLWNEFQGDLEFEYDHEKYWPALIQLCEEKHSEQRARWVKSGSIIGESENYLKGGKIPSIGDIAFPLVDPKTDVPPATSEATDSTPVKENASPEVAEATKEAPGVAKEQPSLVEAPEGAKETSSTAEAAALTHNSSSQANGNKDVVAAFADPVITTEGDRTYVPNEI